MLPDGAKVSGPVGEPTTAFPNTVWPANVCAKLPPIPTIEEPDTALPKSMLTTAADAEVAQKNTSEATEAILVAFTMKFICFSSENTSQEKYQLTHPAY
jgi:hypothetical protein